MSDLDELYKQTIEHFLAVSQAPRAALLSLPSIISLMSARSTTPTTSTISTTGWRCNATAASVGGSIGCPTGTSALALRR